VSDAPAIEVHALSKRYGEFEAVRGIDIAVQRGEVFGLLGPNGAGKTTTVEILEGYRARSAGEVSVLGYDPGKRSRALRKRIGIVLQAGGVYGYITPREALRHWASFYPKPRDVEEVLALAGLTEKADQRSRRLSGGQLRRLDFARASTRRFPCLRLAREAMKKGGAMPCALNAADEVAVAAFLERRLPFLGIPEVIERVLGRMPRVRFEKMDDVLTADLEARRMAKEEVERAAVTAAAAS